MLRKAVFAGSFYFEDASDLKRSIEDIFLSDLGLGYIPKLKNITKNSLNIQNNDSNENNNNTENNDKNKLNNNSLINGNFKKINGAIIPHAGHIYSGPVASYAYGKLVENGFPETFVIICPNHTGVAESPISVFDTGEWETPLGNVLVDDEFAKNLIEMSEIINSDYLPHLREHSIEVHLPFLQYFSKDFKIVPIVINYQNKELIDILSVAIVETIKLTNRNVVVIGSSDFTHYQSSFDAYSNDKLILDAISNFDTDNIFSLVEKYNLSICGYGSIAVTLNVSKFLGSKTFELLKYGTSGDVSGDHSSVVAYMSGTFY
ncbi:MAG: AmmeMemoRadiSam system protein B [Methanobrevibacter sp.]|jgi:AmmeMemoRadiSam system protein B|nr:AmmeMemoRadiSam system protein B [Candidatus Methanoflexus mossambicus]